MLQHNATKKDYQLLLSNRQVSPQPSFMQAYHLFNALQPSTIQKLPAAPAVVDEVSRFALEATELLSSYSPPTVDEQRKLQYTAHDLSIHAQSPSSSAPTMEKRILSLTPKEAEVVIKYLVIAIDEMLGDLNMGETSNTSSLLINDEVDLLNEIVNQIKGNWEPFAIS